MRVTKQAIVRSLLLVVFATLLPCALFAQQSGDKVGEEKSKRRKRKEVVAIADFTQGFSVRGGEKIVPIVRTAEQDSIEVAQLGVIIDSLVAARESLPLDDSLAMARASAHIDSLVARRTELLPAPKDTLAEKVDTIATDTVKKARYNWLFRDSLSLTTTTLASVVLPGFAQLYEEKYWKIPLEYAMVGLPLWAGLEQNKKYRTYKAEYDKLAASGATQEERTPVQSKMMRHQNYSTMLLGTAIASYMGFLVDGVVNHPSDMSDIQKATVLSFVCPGAGQIFNGSYWKLPIVVAGMASMVYVIDWNQRGYTRFKLAYDLATDGDDATISEFPYTSEDQLRSIKNAYRRNRDLAIIGTVAVYLVQVADAHIDAHMQAYDISDNLSMKIEPQITQSVSPQGVVNNFGFNLTMNF